MSPNSTIIDNESVFLGGYKMSVVSMLFAAIILTTIALILYTWSIFKMRKQLRKSHVIGLTVSWLCDFVGTLLFFLVGQQTKTKVTPMFVFHSLLGYLALFLMLILLVMVIRQWKKQSNQLPSALRNYAVIAWLVWVIDYLTGMMVR
ncbi:hypothetical protein LF145_03470 [Limosilactobacillus frumenti]|nr:hypothetical protein LF145_03470 [Limosilactobacillus frumenti]